MFSSGSAELYCSLCRQTWGADSEQSLQFGTREGVCCSHCGLSARLRSSLALLSHFAPDARQVYMTEMATPAFAWAQGRFPEIQGSEFQPDTESRQRLTEHLAALGGHGEVQFQDVTALTFADASMDAVVSLDVLEHVPDYRAAVSEFARVLRPDGVLVATFPFTDQGQTLVRARLDAEGEVEHLMEPEYHGDPLGDGVLCFYHFGWDILDAAKRAGFRTAEMVMPLAPQQGHFYGLWNLLARR